MVEADGGALRVAPGAAAEWAETPSMASSTTRSGLLGPRLSAIDWAIEADETATSGEYRAGEIWLWATASEADEGKGGRPFASDDEGGGDWGAKWNGSTVE